MEKKDHIEKEENILNFAFDGEFYENFASILLV